MKATIFGRRESAAQATGCHPETLSRSRALHGQRCPHCETLSLHFGPITLRFDQETAEGVFTTLGFALTTLHLRREEARAANTQADDSAN